MKKRLHIIVHGQVQGIFFRATAKEKAVQMGISGWIRNNSDGTVEGVFEGEEKSLKEILVFCRHGPSLAKVEEVKEKWRECTNEFRSFDIRY